MSSGSQREQPTGVIRQGNRVVGCIVMPEADDVFIREFNHCYGQLRLSVASTPNPIPKTMDPNTFQLPTWFRHVWHSVHPESTSQPSTDQTSNAPSANGGIPTLGIPSTGIPTTGIPENKNDSATQSPISTILEPTPKPSVSSRKTRPSGDTGAKAKPRRRKPSGPSEPNEAD